MTARHFSAFAAAVFAALIVGPTPARDPAAPRTAIVDVRDKYTGVAGLGDFLTAENVAFVDLTAAAESGALPDLGDYDLVIVGSFATGSEPVRRALDGASDRLREFVARGGVLAMLGQADQDRDGESWMPEPSRLVRSDADADAAFVSRPQHPLLNAAAPVTADDLRGWRVPATWRGPNTLWESFSHWTEAGVILASGPPGTPRTAGLVEAAWGRGRAVFYAMAPDKAVAAGNDAAKRAGADLLRNLVAWAGQVRDGEARPVELTPSPRYAHPLEGTVFLDTNASGRQDDGDAPLEGIPVSDGFEIVLTDADGRYRLANRNADAVFVFVHQDDRVALDGQKFFRRLPAGGTPPQPFDFALKPAPVRPAGAGGIRFAQLTDSHIRNASDRDYMIRATDEIYDMDPPPDFVVATGDLVDWGVDEHYQNYVAGMQQPRVPYFNVFGNHEIARGPIDRYHRFIGPDYYSFEHGGVVFLALNCVTPTARQQTWTDAAIRKLGNGRPVVVFQHYPPDPEGLERFANSGVRSVFSGHWHSEKEIVHAGVQSVNTPTFVMGGIDASPAGFKVVHLKPDGHADTEWRYGFQHRKLTIVSPTGEAPAGAGGFPIVVNAYDTSHDVRSVTWSLGPESAPQAGGELVRESATSWFGHHSQAEAPAVSVPVRVEARDARGMTWSAERQVEFGAEPPAVPAPDADWPAFMGDAAHHGSTPQRVALPLRLAWSVDTGGDPDFASPVYADGRLFLALKKRTAGRTNGVAAFDPRDGRRLWLFETDTAINHTPAFHDGILCVAEMGGRVHGIDAATGKPLWHHDLIDRSGRFSYCAPAVFDGSFFAGVLRRMARLNPADGSVRWQKQIGSADSDWISSYCSPAVHDGILVMGGQFSRGDALVAVRADTGERLWGHRADGGMLASPTIAGDRVLFCTQKSILRCHRLADGAPLWERPLGAGGGDACWSATTPAVGTLPDGSPIVVAGSGDGRMCGVDSESGNILWTHESATAVFKVSPYRRDDRPLVSSPVIAGDKTLFGSADGHVRCLDLATGRELWTFATGVPVMSTPVVTGNAVFAAAYDGRLYAWTSAKKK